MLPRGGYSVDRYRQEAWYLPIQLVLSTTFAPITYHNSPPQSRRRFPFFPLLPYHRQPHPPPPFLHLSLSPPDPRRQRQSYLSRCRRHQLPEAAESSNPSSTYTGAHPIFLFSPRSQQKDLSTQHLEFKSPRFFSNLQSCAFLCRGSRPHYIRFFSTSCWIGC